MGFVGFRQQITVDLLNLRNSGRSFIQSVITYVCTPTFQESTHECIEWFEASCKHEKSYLVPSSSSTNWQFDGFFIPNTINYTSPSVNGWTVNVMTTTKGGATDGLISTQTGSDSYQAYTLSGAIG